MLHILSNCEGIIIAQTSVSVFGGVVFRGHHKTSSFPRPSVDGLNNIYHLLFVFHGPVYFVVVTSAKINHDVFVPETDKQKWK